MFVCQLSIQALSRLTVLCDAIAAANAIWRLGSELEMTLETLGGDIVQSVQALKEGVLAHGDDVEQSLKALANSMASCRAYCYDKKPNALSYPLTRGERQVHDAYAVLFTNPLPMNEHNYPQPNFELHLSHNGRIETFSLAGLQFPRLLNGLWQLSSPAWGSASAERQEDALKKLVESGLTAADMADHYGDAELVYGNFRNKLQPDIQESVFAATKWCLVKPVQVPITESWVLNNVEARCRRLGGRVELLQFHWYDCKNKDWLFILEELVRLTKSRPDLVSAIGLCNFDSQRTTEACEHLLFTTGSVGIVSNQVQFSLLDSRPLQSMCTVCERYGLKLLTYGSLSGGLISEKWMAQPAPEPYSESTRLTPSQRKYFDIITSWGTWSEFQSLLTILARVAAKHKVSVTLVASRWVMQQPAVGAVIVGTRLGVSAHEDENVRVFDFVLDAEDLATINEVALGGGLCKSVALFGRIGDCGHEYRVIH